MSMTQGDTAASSDHIRRAVDLRNQRGGLVKLRDWITSRPEGGIAVLFAAVQIVVIAAALANPQFRYLSDANIAVMLKAIAPLGIMALGVGVLMIAGEFDLSVGSLYSFCAIVTATLSAQWGGDAGGDAVAWAPFAAAAIGLAVGTGAGLLNGYVTLKFNIPSFITTLGAMLMWKGVTLLYHGATSLRFKPSEPFATLFGGSVGIVHASIIWFLIAAVLFWAMLHHHRIGNHFFAVGGNRQAAVAIGINPVKTKLIAFGLTGFMAAFAGIIAGTRVSSIQPGGGQGLELVAIAACVIGGHALMGGRGSILGIVLGTALMFTIQDVLLLMRAPGFYFEMFVGALIVVAVIMNMAIRRRG
ncbi:ABC transporter permease [Poseidonocella sp. HB161398]|uniref:ABC transporter permease n=1 Tax=Poseidonocella sp. HB161398 TaxID=2320855 RepID=UPI00198267AE|nr:ABC transporter permease [Poseidonocella sp. HB161398]